MTESAFVEGSPLLQQCLSTIDDQITFNLPTVCNSPLTTLRSWKIIHLSSEKQSYLLSFSRLPLHFSMYQSFYSHYQPKYLRFLFPVDSYCSHVHQPPLKALSLSASKQSSPSRPNILYLLDNIPTRSLQAQTLQTINPIVFKLVGLLGLYCFSPLRCQGGPLYHLPTKITTSVRDNKGVHSLH